MKPISLSRLENLYHDLRQQKVTYFLGGKAELKYTNPNSTGRLSTPPNTIDCLDCSGLIRYGAYQASGGGLVLPDGSQVQREWCEARAREGQMHQVKHYSDVAKHMTPTRLFIAFIRPNFHGCGDVGHVWFVRLRNNKVVTVESHGGVGVNSRPWNYSTLLNQVYSVYELPTTA